MNKERIGVAIVSDKEKVGLREKLQEEIEKNPNLVDVDLAKGKLGAGA